jgi:outer membrane protein OmpA-like peptidoglycan-associated protein
MFWLIKACAILNLFMVLNPVLGQQLCPVIIQLENQKRTPLFIYPNGANTQYKMVYSSDTILLAPGNYLAAFDTVFALQEERVSFEVIHNGNKTQLFQIKQKELFSPIIYFDKDSYTLQPQAKEQLSAFMNQAFPKNQSIKLVLKGYCDADGDSTYNEALAKARIKAVRDFIAKNKQLEIACSLCLGERQAEGHTPEAMALDRKVVIAFYRGNESCVE